MPTVCSRSDLQFCTKSSLDCPCRFGSCRIPVNMDQMLTGKRVQPTVKPLPELLYTMIRGAAGGQACTMQAERMDRPMAKQFWNSLCKTQGHQWRTSASNQFRICGRDHCRAMERFDGTEWVDATRTYPSKNPLAKEMQQAREQAKTQAKEQHRQQSKTPSLPSPVQQLDLIDAYKASAPLEIDLYSSEEIRQAELSYYRLLGR